MCGNCKSITCSGCNETTGITVYKCRDCGRYHKAPIGDCPNMDNEGPHAAAILERLDEKMNELKGDLWMEYPDWTPKGVHDLLHYIKTGRVSPEAK